MSGRDDRRFLDALVDSPSGEAATPARPQDRFAEALIEASSMTGRRREEADEPGAARAAFVTPGSRETDSLFTTRDDAEPQTTATDAQPTAELRPHATADRTSTTSGPTFRGAESLPVPDDPDVVAQLHERAGLPAEEEASRLVGFLEGLLGILGPEPKPRATAAELARAYEEATERRLAERARGDGSELRREAKIDVGQLFPREDPTDEVPTVRPVAEAAASASATATRDDESGTPATTPDVASAAEPSTPTVDDEDRFWGPPPLSNDPEHEGRRAAAPEPSRGPDLEPVAETVLEPDTPVATPPVADASLAEFTDPGAPAVHEPAPEPARPAAATRERELTEAQAREREGLLAALASFDAYQRRRALLALLDRGLDRELAAGASVSLRDPDIELRYLALQVLERAPELAPDDALRAALLDGDSDIRRRAMSLTGRTGRVDVVPELQQRLAEESDEDVLAAGLVALADIFRVAGSRTDDRSRAAVHRAVGRIPAELLPAVDREVALLARTLDDDVIRVHLGAEDEAVRYGAAMLALHEPNDENNAALARLVTDPSPRIRRLAMTAVARSLSDGGAEPRDGSISASVATSRPATEEAAPSRAMFDEVEQALLPGLLDALVDPKPEIRNQARKALDLVDRSRLVSWVSERARQASTTNELRRLVGAARHLELDQVVPELAAATIALPTARERHVVGSLLGDVPASRDLLATWRSSNDPAERADAIRLALAVEPDDVSPLLAGLEDPNATVRRAAIGALPEPITDQLAHALLELVENDPSSRVRVAAIEAFRSAPVHERLAVARAATASTLADVRRSGLSLLTGNTSEEFHELAVALRDPDPRVVEEAAITLTATPDATALALLWSELRSAREPNRQVVLDVLRQQDPEVLARLARRAVDSADPAERVAGLSALASVGDAEVRDQLVASLGDPSVEVRLEALRALGADPGAVGARPLVAVLRDAEPRVRAAAVDVIAGAEDDEALPRLLEALDDPSEMVRTAARKALGRVRSPATVELLLEALERPAHRGAAIEALANLGDAATDRLIRALQSTTGDVHNAVREALLRSGVVERMVAELDQPRPERRHEALAVLRTLRPPGVVDAVVARLTDPSPSVRAEAARLLGELGDPEAAPALQRAFGSDPDMGVVAAVEAAYRRLVGEEGERP